MMTKQDFIALADAVRNHNADPCGRAPGARFDDDHLDTLASFCHSCNPRFDRERWLEYIRGDCGPNGGRIRKPKLTGNKCKVTPCQQNTEDAATQVDLLTRVADLNVHIALRCGICKTNTYSRVGNCMSTTISNAVTRGWRMDDDRRVHCPECAANRKAVPNEPT